ncbi:CfaE/CblD family pilus tip adhesin [Pseudomonas sp. AMR01]|uniref:CfaE/CblD family pilus tip adhesin n=1 Tax=Pseudomonas sp. AMR01 TaxID=3064904 RepID=UPI0035C1DDC5
MHGLFFKLFFSIIIAAYGLSCEAAISSPIVPVASRTKSVTYNIDKNAVSGDFSIWKDVSGGQGSSNPPSSDDSNYYSRMSWLCQSESNEAVGACASAPLYSSAQVTNFITLQFVEQRTQIKRNIRLTGESVVFSVRGRYSSLTMNSSWGGTGAVGSSELIFKTLNVWIPSSEIKRLPIGGVWTAKLVLTQSSWLPTAPVATWTANITLNLLDSGNIQIYLPEYNTANPTIDLGLKSNGTELHGRVDVQACLYDGFNAQSEKYSITMSDPNSKDNNFYIKNLSRSANSDLKNSIPYEVWISNLTTSSDTSIKMQNNKDHIFSNIRQLTPRLTTLPKIPNPVYCTPWQFSLRANRLVQKEQAIGKYNGTLRIKFTPSTSNF